MNAIQRKSHQPGEPTKEGLYLPKPVCKELFAPSSVETPRQGYMYHVNQASITPPKETNKVPLINPKEMESYDSPDNYDLPDNELKRIN